MVIRKLTEEEARELSEQIAATTCKICGRRLTNPESVKRGVGPVCWAKMKRDGADYVG